MSDVMNVRAMRNFRLRHNIPLQEVADAAGKSNQWVSQVELCQASASKHNQYEMMKAFQHVILDRKKALACMEGEYAEMKQKLLEEEPEWISP